MRATDFALLERWIAARDAEAFSELVHRHAGMVYGTCRRILGDAAEAEDTTQDCFMQLSQAERTVEYSLGGWLHRVAANRALDRLKRDTRRVAREQAYAKERPASAEPEWNDVQPHVDEIIAQLDDDLRTPLVLHFFEGRTHRETAKALGVSRSTVTNRIQRAIQQIREQLDARGVTLAAATLTTLLESAEAGAAPPTLLTSLNKFALAAGKPQSRSIAVRAWRYAPLACVVALLLITVVGLDVSNQSIESDDVPATRLEPSTSEVPAIHASTAPPQSAGAVPSPATVFDAVDQPAAKTPANEHSLQLRCIDREGNPVSGAEVYFVRRQKHTPPMIAETSDEDISDHPYGPVLSDSQGFVQAPNLIETTERFSELYTAYARVPGKSVGVWSWSSEADKEPGWNYAILTPSTSIAGAVEVPHGFDPASVKIKALSIRTRLGNAANQAFGTFFTASTKFRPPIWPELFSSAPDTNGLFQIHDIPVGQGYTLEFTAPGLGEAQASSRNAHSTERITVKIRPEAALSGVVRFAYGAPAPDLPVLAWPVDGRQANLNNTSPFACQTDSSGKYTLSGLPIGTYSLMVQVHGEPPEWVSGVIPAIDVQAGMRYESVDFVLEKGAVQEGFVLDKTTNEAIPDTYLAAMNPGDVENVGLYAQCIGVSKTDSNGKFSFRLPTGESFLYFFGVPDEYERPPEQGRTHIAVSRGETTKTPVTFKLDRKTTEDAPPIGHATIQGRIVNEAGQPLSGVPVSAMWKFYEGDTELWLPPATDRTNESGRFAFTLQSKGEYQFEAGGQAFSKATSDWFSLSDNESRTFSDIVLEEYRKSIRVQVLNLESGPPSRRKYAFARLKESGKLVAASPIDASGQAEFFVPDPPLDLYVQCEGYEIVKMDAAPGFEYEVDLVRKASSE